MTESRTLPLAQSPAEQALPQRVQAVLDTLRPLIQWDGGDVELVDVDDKGVSFR